MKELKVNYQVKPNFNDIKSIKDIKVLIVDDENVMSAILRSMLKHIGFNNIFNANCINEAKNIIDDVKPELILLDQILKNETGYDLCLWLKEKKILDDLVVIAITGSDKEESIVQAYESGCDDYITKPISPFSLKTRVIAHFHRKKLFHDLKSAHEKLAISHANLINQQETAKEVLDFISRKSALGHRAISYIQSSTSILDGDLLLAGMTRDDRLNIMLCNFSGKGISGAIGSIPTANTFYSMTEEGCDLEKLIHEINDKLCLNLPSGIFCRAIFVSIDPSKNEFSYWLGGSEGLVLYDNSNKNASNFTNDSLALGILRDDFVCKVKKVSYKKGDRIFLISDYVINAEDGSGNTYGLRHLMHNIEQYSTQQNSIDLTMKSVLKFARQDESDAAPPYTLMEIYLDMIK